MKWMMSWKTLPVHSQCVPWIKMIKLACWTDILTSFDIFCVDSFSHTKNGPAYRGLAPNMAWLATWETDWHWFNDVRCKHIALQIIWIHLRHAMLYHSGQRKLSRYITWSLNLLQYCSIDITKVRFVFNLKIWINLFCQGWAWWEWLGIPSRGLQTLEILK